MVQGLFQVTFEAIPVCLGPILFGTHETNHDTVKQHLHPVPFNRNPPLSDNSSLTPTRVLFFISECENNKSASEVFQLSDPLLELDHLYRPYLLRKSCLIECALQVYLILNILQKKARH